MENNSPNRKSLPGIGTLSESNIILVLRHLAADVNTKRTSRGKRIALEFLFNNPHVSSSGYTHRNDLWETYNNAIPNKKKLEQDGFLSLWGRFRETFNETATATNWNDLGYKLSLSVTGDEAALFFECLDKRVTLVNRYFPLNANSLTDFLKEYRKAIAEAGLSRYQGGEEVDVVAASIGDLTISAESMAERTLINYRGHSIPEEYLQVIIEFLENRYQRKAFIFNGRRLPVVTLWENTDASILPDNILGSLDRSEPHEIADSELRSFIKKVFERGTIREESISVCLKELMFEKGLPRITGSLGLYYDNILTQNIMEWELNKLSMGCSSVEQLRTKLESGSSLPLRTELESKYGRDWGKLFMCGKHRCASMTIATFFVFKRCTRSGEHYYCTIHRRSEDVVVSPGMYHVVPSGMFELTCNDPDVEWSIENSAMRELLEEVYDEKEVSESKTAISNAENREPIPRLKELIREGSAQFGVSGICIDLKTFTVEICTVLLVHDTEFVNERTMKLNWEYTPDKYRSFAICLEELDELLENTIKNNIVCSGAVCIELGKRWIKRNGMKGE